MNLYAQLRNTLAPGLENSEFTYADALEAAAATAESWLDLGCGHAILPDWMAHRGDVFRGKPIGIDVDRASVRAHRDLKWGIVGDAQRLPFRAGSFDLVTANMVVEHIAFPDEMFRELHYVLKPGGRVLLHTPNLAGYTTRLVRLVPGAWKPAFASAIQHRCAADVYPTYYRANTEAALRALAAGAGFEVERIDHVLTSAQLWRVPPLLVFEMFWIHHIARPGHTTQLPVLIAMFARGQ